MTKDASTQISCRPGAPEKSVVRIGFLPLTDCASVVMASELGFDRKYGVKIDLCRESSWASVRDKLVAGELDLAHVLYGLVYGVHLGIAGPRRDMAITMTLNQNGQGLSLSRQIAAKGAVNLASLLALMQKERRRYTFAQTFPTGTHALWLYYWLASAGINPFSDVRTVVVPPAQMVAHARTGQVDGFCVGEPWNHRGIAEGVSVHAASSQDVWPDHPEKVLAASAEFVDRYPNTARAVTAAVLEASRWIEASAANQQRMLDTLAQSTLLNTPVETISGRIRGHYQDGLGNSWTDPNPMKFHAQGAVNFPYLSDAMWFMTQFKRWGLLPRHPAYEQVARQVQRIDLYRDAAAMAGVSADFAEKRSSVLIDGKCWTGDDPATYADSFDICHPCPQLAQAA